MPSSRSEPTEFSQAILHWYRQNNRLLPWRTRWAEEHNPYHIWLSEIMLQQTLIKVVVPAYERFLREFPSIQAVAKANEESIRLACRGLGYYRRFGLFHKAAQLLVSREPFSWPSSYEEWKALPGIGVYTAAAIASIVNGEAVAVLDGNVERVLCRILDIRKPIASPGLKNELQKQAQERITSVDPGGHNQGVMELGQLVCTNGEPNCNACPVSGFCLAYKNNSQRLAPAPKMRSETLDVHIVLLICSDASGRLGLVRRSESAKFLAGIAGFPAFLMKDSTALEPLGFACDQVDEIRATMKKIGNFRHSITNHKITGTVFQVASIPFDGLEFYHPSEIEPFLVSNLDRKALACLARFDRS